MALPMSQPPIEVLFEHTQLGNSVKVTAVDPRTGIEASILGPARYGQKTLENAALKKLLYVLNKKAGER